MMGGPSTFALAFVDGLRLKRTAFLTSFGIASKHAKCHRLPVELGFTRVNDSAERV